MQSSEQLDLLHCLFLKVNGQLMCFIGYFVIKSKMQEFILLVLLYLLRDCTVSLRKKQTHSELTH